MAGRSDRRQAGWWVAALAAGVLVAAAPTPAAAQLLSPGHLATPHADLDGLRHCTSCHELGRRGVAPERCLACHEPLAARIAAGTGLHASSRERNCSECHKDHFGRDFALVRFDTSAFRHASDVGYALEGAHAELACRDCHTAKRVEAADVKEFKGAHGALERTLLGLGTECASCHRADDPHGEQFAGESCDACHGEDAWRPTVAFDHGRTRYPLTGRHREVSCDGCHAGSSEDSRSYSGVAFASCTACHRDVHGGAMGARCESCHSTAGWGEIPRSSFERRFDHSRTGFALEGAHADAACASCHARRPGDGGFHMRFAAGTSGRAYPRVLVDGCASCHVDEHHGAFATRPGGGACEECHGQTAWFPTSYDVARHNRDASFALTGAHVAVPCDACHRDVEPSRPGWSFRRAADTCGWCHERDDPHDGQFAALDCATCHDTDAFRVDTFDHARTRFPLDGAHRDAPCASCHRTLVTPDGRHVTRYRPLGTACVDCHTGKP